MSDTNVIIFHSIGQENENDKERKKMGRWRGGIYLFYPGTTKGEIDAERSCGNLVALVYVDGNMVDVSSEDSSSISY